MKNPLVVFREEFDDWAVLFDPDTGDGFGLNPTGAIVWKCLEGGRTVLGIAEDLQGCCEDVPDTVIDDVASFVDDLAERGLVGYEL